MVLNCWYIICSAYIFWKEEYGPLRHTTIYGKYRYAIYPFAFKLAILTFRIEYQNINDINESSNHNVNDISLTEIPFLMMTSSNGNICAFVRRIHRSPVNSPHKGQWRAIPPFVRRIHRSPVNSPYKGLRHGALMFSLICVWINDW